MVHIAVVVDVLHKGAAERDVEHLVAPADRQEREARLDGGARHRQVERVVIGIDAVHPRIDDGRAVTMRVDIGPARQAHPVEPGERLAQVIEGVGKRRQHHRLAAGSLILLSVLGFWLYWRLSGRKWFTGPKVQGTPEELAAIERELEALGQGAPITPGSAPLPGQTAAQP